MATTLLQSFAGKLLGELCSPALLEIKLLWGSGSTNELEKLKATVSSIKAVLLDADEKQSTNREIEDWLYKIKDAFYEADDLLDDLSRNKSANKVRVFFSRWNQIAFRLKMGRRVRLIRERLDSIASDRIKFHLIERHEDFRFDIRRDEETHSFVPAERVIGREKDKKAITELLLNSDGEDNVSTVSIVGIGGLGKTTLAQFVYNVEQVQNHFELTMWVCVSNVFDVKLICEKIIESATKRKCDRAQMDGVKDEVKAAIDGKRYLLVLDDIWNEDAMKWMRLEELLMGGAKGSKIVVTTRSEVVAKTTRSVRIHILKGLSVQESWSLFKLVAFRQGQVPENPTIVAIGKEACKKCAGAPLAIKALGGMLVRKDTERDWLYFKNNDLPKIIQQTETGIIPILKLSYDSLSGDLKRCFTFCAIFPKDGLINKNTLIQLWMAHGLIQLSDGRQYLEDVGEEYFMELRRRSFFQDVEEDELEMSFSQDFEEDMSTTEKCFRKHNLSQEVCFKMHDLIHDLALSIERKETCAIDLLPTDLHAMTRHIRVSREVPICLFQSNKVRTLLSESARMGSLKSNRLMKSFKHLRVLAMTKSGVERVSGSVGVLGHLRYLDLSRNNFEVLPESICNLQNLETLKLNECAYLKKLPQGTKNLASLRHLEFHGCSLLSCMPCGLGKLTSLQTLTRFIIDHEGRSCSGGIYELQSLVNMRGLLTIQGLRGSVSKTWKGRTNYPSYLIEMEFLQFLSLHWLMIDEGQLSLFETLQPHKNLKILHLYGYCDVSFPSWMHTVDIQLTLPNIVEIVLDHCPQCQHLPPFGLLPSLRVLKLSNMHSLKYIYEECYCISDSNDSSSSSSEPQKLFQTLKTLHLTGMLALMGLDKRREPSTMVQVQPLIHFTSLEELHIEQSPQLNLLTDGKDDENVERFLNLVNLRTLSIFDMPDMETIPVGFQYLTNLQSLSISQCYSLVGLPESMSNLVSLQKLRVHACVAFASLPRLTSLQVLYVSNCPRFFRKCKDQTGEEWSKNAHVPHISVRE